MADVYVIDRLSTVDAITKRVSLYHGRVFHGELTYENEHSEDWLWPPFLTNTVRDLPHIARSGRFVPPVFGRSALSIFVSAEVKEKLSVLQNVDFLPVVFEQLVDLEMPELGDFSWMREEHKYDHVEQKLDKLFGTLPDVPEFHSNIGEYFLVLTAQASELVPQYDDIKEFKVEWSPYAQGSLDPVKLSKKMMQDYPIVWDKALCFREDAFTIIAPYLNFDFYTVSMVDLAPVKMSPAMREFLKQRFQQGREAK